METLRKSTVDASEDCKVCVTESLLLLLHAGCGQVRLSVSRSEGLNFELVGKGGVPSTEKTTEEEISVALLTALVEDFSVERTQQDTRITFGFKGL